MGKSVDWKTYVTSNLVTVGDRTSILLVANPVTQLGASSNILLRIVFHFLETSFKFCALCPVFREVNCVQFMDGVVNIYK
jgi:hypothetical protein